MARTYKRDARGRFAGGGGGGGKKGGGGGKGTVAQRKQAMNKQVTGSMLLGKGPRNAQRERYISSQNRNANAERAAGAGKGSKAARRAAAVTARAAASSRATTSSKPKTSRGPRGGKVGSKTEQRRNAQAQAQRQATFSSKARSSSAKAAYKSASSNLRFERSARAAGGGSKGRVKKAQSAVTRMRRTRGR